MMHVTFPDGASLIYYRETLGFGVEFEWGTPAACACLCRDEAAIHLASERLAQRAPGQSALCLFVNDVDALYAEFLGKGARIGVPLADRAYGMRDFALVDSDGNKLALGMALACAAAAVD